MWPLAVHAFTSSLATSAKRLIERAGGSFTPDVISTQAKRCRADDATYITVVALSRFVVWPRLLTA